MPGPATYACDEHVAVRARRQLDETRRRVAEMEAAQRQVIEALVSLWPDSGWLAAGARTARGWLKAYTGQSDLESLRLERIARLCSRNERLADAVVEGSFPLGWAEALSRVVTQERAQFLTDDVVAAMLALPSSGVSDEQFGDVVRYWSSKADEELAPQRVQPHSLVACQTLFGGGEIHAQLAPVAFQNIMGAIDAFTQDPDPTGSPYQRTLSERRADALDDVASYATTHGGHSDDGCGLSHDDDDDLADDTFDGTAPGDLLDELLDDEPDPDPDDDFEFDFGFDLGDQGDNVDETDAKDEPTEPGHELEALRRQLRKRVLHRRRRAGRQVRPRSNSRVNVHIDFPTLTGQRGIADFDGLVLRGEGWTLARSAAEQFLCDSTLVATLFAGQRVLDANTDAEHFTNRQRRAIAARDRHCVFPGCRRPPRHCDAHHLHERNDGGPTTVENGCLLCRFHHRLLHQFQWKLRMTDDGWIATDPHGTSWHERRPTEPAAH